MHFLNITAVIVSVIFVGVQCCNDAKCGSIVSKCLLIKSCNCELKNYTCYRECGKCLGILYSECCSCLEFCPVLPNKPENLSTISHVEDFNDNTDPELFKAFTEYPDVYSRWMSQTYPVSGDVNCTVAFWAECMSWTVCKSKCGSMGANGYRWFHDGCCECIGPSCINYGIKESSCTACPFEKEEKDDYDESDYEWTDFKEDEGDGGTEEYKIK